MPKYKACDFFMVRTPTMPIEKYFDIFDNKFISEKKNLMIIAEDPIFQEALAVASKDLFESLHKTDWSQSSKSINQLLSTILKYFIRITTRPTPFGLFAGISIGKFEEQGELVIFQNEGKKRARADMEWVYQFIKKLEENEDLQCSLKVRFNDFVNHNGNRLELPSKSFLQQVEKNNIEENASSIRFTRPVQYLEEYAKNFHTITELVEKIKKKYPQITNERIKNFIVELLKNEYIISELRPPLINTDALSYLDNILQKNNSFDSKYILQLENILNAITLYNNTCLGNGQIEYQEIINMMKELNVSKNYLQVDIKNKMSKSTINYKYKTELENFVEVMYRITPERYVSNDISYYSSLFSEKYGYDVEVPILEVLDIDRGIGAPANYYTDVIPRPIPEQPKHDKIKRLDILLKRKTILALRQGKTVIELTDDDITYIEGNRNVQIVESLPPIAQSFELYFLAHQKGKFHFTVAPAVGSLSVGRSFGRFTDLLSVEESRLLKDLSENQNEMLDGYIIAEISELPSRGRTSNVAINNSSYHYQISLNTNPCKDKESISIQDLYIGLDANDNCFYIRSKNLGKRVLVTTSSMLNPTFGSNIYRFLREISNIRFSNNILNTIYYLINMDEEYSPRLVYKNIIIRPETWKISKDALGIKEDTKTDFYDRLLDYCKKWKLPRYVFLAEADNRLMLDLNNQLHIEEIRHALKENKIITFQEVTCDTKDYAVTDQEQRHYVTEIVVPFVDEVKKEAIEENKIKVTSIDRNFSDASTFIKQENKIITPGQKNWLYYKLYGCKKRQNELLSNIAIILENMRQDKLIKKYFFIRYADPEFHFRVRINTADGNVAMVFERLSKFLEECRTKGMLSKVVIDTYQRESERYGGEQLIEAAEEYFFHDSYFVMELINRKRYGILDIELEFIAVSFISAAAKAFAFSQEEQEKLLGTRVKHSDYRKDFQKERKIFIAAVDYHNKWTRITSIIQNQDIYELLDITMIHLKEYVQKVYQLSSQNKTGDLVERIFFSIVHMFCNRLIGSNVWEKKIYAITRHALHAYIEEKKYKCETI